MCMNPMKALPYAVGGLVGGSVLKSVFGKKKDKTRIDEPVRTTSATAAAQSSGAANPYTGG